MAKPVGTVDADLRLLASNMMATMHINKGVGLAAPQIGESIRLIVFDVVSHSMNAKDSAFMFNPEIIEEAGKKVDKEGCLSYPGLWVDIERPENIKVKFMDIAGRQREENYTGVAARVIKHEIEHLNGITIEDYRKEDEH